MKISRIYSRFYKCNSGAAFIEFALILPLIILLFVGGVELANFVYAGQKLQNAANNISNLIARQNQLEGLADIVARFPDAVAPLPANINDYKVIVTIIQRNQAGSAEQFPFVNLQAIIGNASGNSNFDYNRNAANNGNIAVNRVTRSELDMQFFPGDQVIIVEAYMNYSPIVTADFANFTLRHMAAPTRPRAGFFTGIDNLLRNRF